MAFFRNYEDGFKFRQYESHVARIGGEFPKQFLYFEWVETYQIITPVGLKHDFINREAAEAFLADQRSQLMPA